MYSQDERQNILEIHGIQHLLWRWYLIDCEFVVGGNSTFVIKKGSLRKVALSFSNFTSDLYLKVLYETSKASRGIDGPAIMMRFLLSNLVGCIHAAMRHMVSSMEQPKPIGYIAAAQGHFH